MKNYEYKGEKMKKGIFLTGIYNWIGEHRVKKLISLVSKIEKDKEILKMLNKIDKRIPLDIFHSCYLLIPVIDKNHELYEILKNIVDTIINDSELRCLTVMSEKNSMIFSVNFIIEILKTIMDKIEQNSDYNDQSQSESLINSIIQQIDKEEIYQIIKKTKEKTKNAIQLCNLYGKIAGKEPSERELLEQAIETPVVDVTKLLQLLNGILLNLKMRKINEGVTVDMVKFGKEMPIVLSDLLLPDELFYYKYASESLLCYTAQTTNLNDIIICLDVSGSMNECNKTEWSRAVALALAKLSYKYKSNAYLLMFENIIVLEPTHIIKQFNKVMKHILFVPSDGGTNIDLALKTADKFPYAKTILLITDGEDNVRYKPKKKLISVMINGHNETLQEISYKYLTVKPTVSGALKIIDAYIE